MIPKSDSYSCMCVKGEFLREALSKIIMKFPDNMGEPKPF